MTWANHVAETLASLVLATSITNLFEGHPTWDSTGPTLPGVPPRPRPTLVTPSLGYNAVASGSSVGDREEKPRRCFNMHDWMKQVTYVITWYFLLDDLWEQLGGVLEMKAQPSVCVL